MNTLLMHKPTAKGRIGSILCSFILFLAFTSVFVPRNATASVVVDIFKNEQDMIVQGEAIFDGLGYPLFVADITGDGLNDMIFAATGSDGPEGSRVNAGAVYVIFGKADIPITVVMAKDADLTIYGVEHGINGVEGDEVAYALAAADINRDGIDDLIMASIWGDGPGNTRPDAGDIQIIYGRSNFPKVLDLAVDTDIFIYGIDGGDGTGDPEDPDKGDILGEALGTGDLNGDGFPDIVMSAVLADGPGESRIHSGECYILWGRANMPAIVDLRTETNMTTIFGADLGDFLGADLFVKDINNDGKDDLMLSSVLADGPGESRENCGETYIIYGKASMPSTIDLRTDADVTIYGADAGDQFFQPVLYLGAADFNGDKVIDLVIGAPWADGADNATFESGEVYLLFGGPTPFPAIIDLATDADVVLYGINEEDHCGHSVGVGDINNDGIDDLVIAAADGDGLFDTRTSSGEIYVVYGRSEFPPTYDLADADVLIYGAEPFDFWGVPVFCGDANTDNIDDLLLGAIVADGADNAIDSVGEAVVIFGTSSGIGIDAITPKPGEEISSYPVFEWTPGRADNVVWVFRLAESPEGSEVIHTSEFLIEPNYALPDDFFNDIPANRPLYWSVFGTTDPNIPPQRVQESRRFKFTRIGLHLLSPEEPEVTGAPPVLEWTHGFSENDSWAVQISDDPNFDTFIMLSPVLHKTKWEMSWNMWAKIPTEKPLYWRVMGFYQPVEWRLLSEWSQETWPLTRIQTLPAMSVLAKVACLVCILVAAFLITLRAKPLRDAVKK